MVLDNEIKRNCRQFKGDIPCVPHKKYGVHCNNCNYFEYTDGIILIIKLGAIGDVIRTSPILTKIKKEFPNSIIWWLTNFPDILPVGLIDKCLTFSSENLIILQAIQFKKIINLDKDLHACSITKLLVAEEKFGFTLENGKPYPVNEFAIGKYITGIFDDINKLNRKSYLDEIFEICGFHFSGEDYILDFDKSYSFTEFSEKKNIIGLNTGCGDRWVSRLWKEEHWLELIFMLQKEGFFPLLLGGKGEHERNNKLSSISGACYLGFYPIKQFIALMNYCDVVVSAVTMAMHIAIGLKKKLVLMNNIFNPNEFELYGRGEIVTPSIECKCYFSPSCTNTEYFCMDYIKPEQIFNSVVRQINSMKNEK